MHRQTWCGWSWLLVLSCVCLTVSAQVPDIPPEQGAAGLYQALQRLNTTASVLHVVAHPDDEDGAMLTYSARGQAAHTMLFSITRGEGGANLISSDFFDALGILRTLEHQKSAEYYGIELFYSHAVDYGYSKTLQEALTQWRGENTVLEDLVRVVRRERPDVIAARFRGDSRDGHGHHQLSGVLARLAFDAAADPKRFPRQLEHGLRPWQPRKLYHDNIRPDWRSEDRDAWTLALPTGEYDPLLGRSYAQIARYGLGFQRSQGISGHDGPAGPRMSYYRLVRSAGIVSSDAKETSFWDGLDTSIEGIAERAMQNPPAWLREGLSAMQVAANGARNEFHPVQVEKVVEPLVEGLRATRNLLTLIQEKPLSESARDELQFHLQRKEAEFEDALARALALDFTSTAHDTPAAEGSSPFRGEESGFQHAVPGQSFYVRLALTNRGEYEVRPVELSLDVPSTWQAETPETAWPTLGYNEAVVAEPRVQLPSDAKPTKPYWRRASIREPLYEISETEFAGQPFAPPPVWGRAEVEIMNTKVFLRLPVRVKFRHPDLGRVAYPLDVVPAVGVRFLNENGVVPSGENEYPLSVAVKHGGHEHLQGELRLEIPEDWACDPVTQKFSFEKEGEEATFEFMLKLPPNLPPRRYVVQATATADGKSYDEGWRTITARDLSRYNLFTPARHELQAVDLDIAENLGVGYIMGSGDEVPAALSQLGCQVMLLDESDVAAGDLSSYDVIVVGVRAYAVRADLRNHNDRLLKYVHDGGVMIVQYQTPEFDNNYGPYPYRQGRSPEEVSEEDAEVTILEPNHVVLSRPNRITVADFEGWVEQRGSKFWQSWDERYTPLLECHDQGQSPQRGGMLFTQYGQGFYIYSAYAWYRQLPAGVPGAYRIYANMLSLPRTLSR